MDTKEYIAKKFGLDLAQKSPLVIRVSRFKGFIDLFRELGFKVGAEIGVANGRYSKWLCNGIPGLELNCVDPWLSYDEYVEHHDEAGQVILDQCFESAKERLKGYNCKFIRKSSMDAVKAFEDNSLDFVFIDANHSFQYVINDIAEWSKKVRPGGIVSGHDFWNSSESRYSLTYKPTPEEEMKLCQVKDAVYSWTATNRIKTWFRTKGDSCPSWFWVKQ